MSEESVDVVIIGGGIGGLCLVQGLKKAGIRAHVYERDASMSSRPQGFRIHIDPVGSTALHQCLPEESWHIFDTTQGEFSSGFAFLTEQLDELLRFGREGNPQDAIAKHRSISRITLRAILLSGLGDTVHFGKRLARYEQISNERTTAYFEDGTTAECSVLIGADGVNSSVRKQRFPGADPVETGVIGIAGKVPLTDGVLALVPPALLDGPALVIPPQQSSLFMGIWKRSAQSADRLRGLGVEEHVADEKDYLILAFGASAQYLKLRGDPRTASRPELKQILRDGVRHWHPNLRKLAEMAEESEMAANPIRSSTRLSAWQPARVTLLGDAIHSMTPYRGIGANIALRDAALLCSKLIESAKGNKPILQAIGEYEAAMRDYAFNAVEDSLRAMNQAVSRKGNPAFGLARTAMRIVNKVPPLRRRLAAV